MTNFEDNIKPPEWLVKLEKRQNKHCLAHEKDAGASCLKCDSCPGLDLHFWRKICKNCKCKREAHQVTSDDSFAHIVCLIPSYNTKQKKKLFGLLSKNGKEDKVTLDWVPPDVPYELVCEYIDSLPQSKVPISNTPGALYRRQQIDKQIPLHDFDPRLCHELTTPELKELENYASNVRQNVVGQGRLVRIPVVKGFKSHSSSVHIVKPCLVQPIQNLNEGGGVHSGRSSPIVKKNDTDKEYIRQCTPSAYQNQIPKDGSFDVLCYRTGHVEHSNLQHPFCPHYSTDLRQNNQNQYLNQDPKDGIFTQIQNPHTYLEFSEKLNNPNSHQTCQNNKRNPYYLQHGEYYNTKPNNQEYPQLENRNFENREFVENPNHESEIQGKYNPMNKHHLPEQFSGQKWGTGLNNKYSDEILMKPGYQKETNPQFSKNAYLINDICGARDGENYPSSGNDSFHPAGSNGYQQNPAQASKVTFLKSRPSYHIGQSGDVALQGPNFSKQIQNCKVYHQKSGDGFIPEKYDESVQQNRNFQSAFRNDNKRNPINTQNSAEQVFIDQEGGFSNGTHFGNTNYGNPDKSLNEMEFGQLPYLCICPPYPGDLETANVAQLPENLENLSINSKVICEQCSKEIKLGNLAIVVDKKNAVKSWHPECFICSVCKELLVDLLYFYFKGKIYCGRDYAQLCNIPRCYACDELIFMKTYTCAEGQAFHLRHFCCLECDVSLAGEQYLTKMGHPICLPCYHEKYAKHCHSCREVISAAEKAVCLNDLSWHANEDCFVCYQCKKSLLQSKFVLKNNQPFCNKACVLACGTI